MAARLSTVVLAAVMAGGLELSGAVAAPAGARAPAWRGAEAAAEAASVAAAKAEPKAWMVVSKKRTKTTTKPFRYRVTSRTPVLKGSAAKNRALVAKHVKKLMAEERALVVNWRKQCDAPTTAETVVSNVSASVFKKRYASATMAFESHGGCPLLWADIGRTYTARLFTLDLKTGKKVKLSKFAALSKSITYYSILAAVMEQNPGCLHDEYIGDPYSKKLPSPSGWNVSIKDVRVCFTASLSGTAGACSSRR